MKTKYISLLILFISACAAENELPVLYSNNLFDLYKNKIVEEDYSAIALSSNSLVSNYSSPEKVSTNIKIRFSINGEDNEFAPEISHILNVDQTTKSVLLDTITFGQQYINTQHKPTFFRTGSKVRFSVDLRHIFRSFKSTGYYIFNTGDTLFENEFKNISITGNTKPLNQNYKNNRNLLSDKNNDGIYDIEISFNPVNDDSNNSKKWKQTKDLSNFPIYTSEQLIGNAIYNLSLEELLSCISEDKLFKQSKNKQEITTLDLSLSTLLSFAIIEPELCKATLKSKIKNDIIVQDKGTGGSWPISSDRISWIIAAYEIYKVIGDKEWLHYAYDVSRNSIETDLRTIFDSQIFLINGEQSYLKGQSQNYPEWMNPVDIFNSKSLNNNAIHYMAYKTLSEMAEELGKYSAKKYSKIADNLKKSINTYLWMPEKGYYAEYLYGQNFFLQSPHSETLGQCFTVLFDIADKQNQRKVIENTDLLEYGTPAFYPQLPNQPFLYNNSIWPFVNSFYTWASAKTGNFEAVKYGLATTWRQAALFVTNKKSILASSGSYKGIMQNEDAYINSVAGNLALYFRVLFGMNFKPEGIEFKPIIPKTFDGTKTLSGLKYRNARLNITVKGYGNKVKSIFLDGVEQKESFISSSLTGNHSILIQLNNEEKEGSKINIVKNIFSLETPKIRQINNGFAWNKVTNAEQYTIFKNGRYLTTVTDTFYSVLNSENYREFQVSAISKNKESFLSKPVVFSSSFSYQMYEMENYVKPEIINPDMEIAMAANFIEISKHKNKYIRLKIDSDQKGEHLIRFRYSNASPFANNDNRCAIRSLYVNYKYAGAVVMPQHFTKYPDNWLFSNSIPVHLKKGINTIELKFTSLNENMNFDENKALLDQMVIINLKPNARY